METEQETESKQAKNVAIKKGHLLAIIGAVVMVSFFVFAAQASVGSAGNAPNNNYITGKAGAGPAAPLQGGKQVVKLSMQNGKYMPYPVQLKKGIPAVFDVDIKSVGGCYRAIQIPAFGVKKIVNANDNKIEFTPDKAGTFGFSCYMGMGKGQIVVEDEAGNVPAGVNTVAQDIPAGGSCGAGGCGCGGA